MCFGAVRVDGQSWVFLDEGFVTALFLMGHCYQVVNMLCQEDVDTGVMNSYGQTKIMFKTAALLVSSLL